MSRKYGNRVAEITTTTSTGPLALLGAVTGYGRFRDEMTVGDTAYYGAFGVDSSLVPTGEWEAGIGTYSAADTLTRTTVEESSNSGAAVNFSAGNKVVVMSPTASFFASLITTGMLTSTFTSSGGVVDLANQSPFHALNGGI